MRGLTILQAHAFFAVTNHTGKAYALIYVKSQRKSGIVRGVAFHKPVSSHSGWGIVIPGCSEDGHCLTSLLLSQSSVDSNHGINPAT